MSHKEPMSMCEEIFEFSFLKPSENGRTLKNPLFRKSIKSNGFSIEDLKAKPFDIKGYIEDLAKENNLPSCDVFVLVIYEQDEQYVDSDETFYYYDAETKTATNEIDLENELQPLE